MLKLKNKSVAAVRGLEPAPLLSTDYQSNTLPITPPRKDGRRCETKGCIVGYRREQWKSKIYCLFINHKLNVRFEAKRHHRVKHEMSTVSFNDLRVELKAVALSTDFWTLSDSERSSLFATNFCYNSRRESISPLYHLCPK